MPTSGFAPTAASNNTRRTTSIDAPGTAPGDERKRIEFGEVTVQDSGLKKSKLGDAPGSESEQKDAPGKNYVPGMEDAPGEKATTEREDAPRVNAEDTTEARAV
jgi:hypothetical protein